MSAWSGAYDDFDEGMDRPLEILGEGGAAVYHVNDGINWKGPTDFFITDYRSPMAPGESKTWTPIHLWANPDAPQEDTMILSIEGSAGAPPPGNRTYTLELLYVPPGINGAPPVGTIWEVPPSGLFMVDVPTFATYDGLESYQFAFTVGPVENSDIPTVSEWGVMIMAVLLAATAGTITRRRRATAVASQASRA
jgi:hypothetical protein